MSSEISSVEEKHERQFQGVWIPAQIWEDTRISWMQKCLLAEIHFLEARGAGCHASNDYFGKLFGTTPESIANQIAKLRKLGFIEDVAFDGRKRWIRVLGYGPEGLPKRLPRVNQTMKAGLTKQLTLSDPSYIQENLDEHSCRERDHQLHEQASAVYDSYPRKVARPKAIAAILKVLVGSKHRKPYSPQKLLDKTKEFAATWEGASKTEFKYCPHPARWFSEERFEDDPSTWRPKERSHEYNVPNI